MKITKHITIFYLRKSSSFWKSISLSIILGLFCTTTIHPSSNNNHRINNLNNQLLSNPSEWIICGPTSWEDLKNYLPEAKIAGVSVSVMLLPPFQSTPVCTEGSYSEPFGNDYIRWAQEIASLSLRYSNLTQFGIYELRKNLDLGYLRQTYIDSVITAAKSINPRLQFISQNKIFYVDRDATGNGDGTSWTNAAKTPYGLVEANINAGDTVYISGGSDSTTYVRGTLDNLDNLMTGLVGSAGADIVITKGWEAGHNGDVYFTTPHTHTPDFSFALNNSSYVKVTGFYMTAATNPATDSSITVCHILNSDHITIDNCNIVGDGSGVGIRFANNSKLCTVNNCYIETPDIDNTVNQHGNTENIFVSGGDGGYTITNNTLISYANGTYPHIDQVQFAVSGSANLYQTVVANNFFYFAPTETGQGANQLFISESTGDRYLIYNNLFVNYPQSDYMTSIHFDTQEVTDHLSARIFNNTIVTGRLTTNSMIVGVMDTMVIKNNIIVHDSGTTAYINFDDIYDARTIYKDIDYNHYWSNNAVAANMVDVVSHAVSWGDWQALGYDTHSDTSTISFVSIWDSTALAYKLMTGSDGIDHGTDLSAFFTTDILGVTRPKGEAWDKGALEQ